MRLAKYFLQAAFFFFHRSKKGRCKPQKIFSKPQILLTTQTI